MKGKLLGYKPGIMKDFDAILNNPHGSAEQRKVKLNDDGSFSAEFDVSLPPLAAFI